MTARGRLKIRVARFFLMQLTKTGKMYENNHKIYQMASKYTNSHRMDQVVMKYTNIFYCKTLKNLPKSGFLV
jgi:hypothetical protein